MSKKAYKITRRNQLNARYKKAEEFIRKFKQCAKKMHNMIIDTHPAFLEEDQKKFDNLDIQAEEYAKEIRKCGLSI